MADNRQMTDIKITYLFRLVKKMTRYKLKSVLLTLQVNIGGIKTLEK